MKAERWIRACLGVFGIRPEDGRMLTNGRLAAARREIFGRLDRAEYDRLVEAY